MKRFLLSLLLLGTAALPAHADLPTVLTPEGVLYRVDSQAGEGGRHLVLSEQSGEMSRSTLVPATVGNGYNWLPELAYDSESRTLFAVWLRSQDATPVTSEILFCSYKDGSWNEPTVIDEISGHLRENLRVALTRVVEHRRDDRTPPRLLPGLTVHLAWWDRFGNDEVARYAMLTVEQGKVTDRYVRNLPDLMNGGSPGNERLHSSVNETLRQLTIFGSAARDTVEIVFGNMATSTLHRIMLKPVAEHRIRIPINVRDSSYPAPRNRLTSSSDARISATPTTPDRLVIFAREATAVKYQVFENGSWTATRTITLSDRVTEGEALSALRRMARGD